MPNLEDFKQFFNEMAQSTGDPKVRLELDDEDIDFINQAVAQGVTSASAIIARYAELPKMGLDNDNPIRMKISATGGSKVVFIKRPHFFHLMKKFDRLGLKQAIKNGLQNFTKVDAKNLLDGRRNKNTGNIDHFISVNYMNGFEPAKSFDREWGKTTANAKTDTLPGYEDVIKSVGSLVGSKIPKEIWNIFLDGVKHKDYLERIKNIVARMLHSGNQHDALNDIAEFKSIMRQVMARLIIQGQQKANNWDKYPEYYGKPLIGIAQWVNTQARHETQEVLRNWYGVRIKTITPEFDKPPQPTPQNSLQVSPTSNLSIAPKNTRTATSNTPDTSMFPNIDKMRYTTTMTRPPIRQPSNTQPINRMKKSNKSLVATETTNLSNEVAGATGVVSPIKPGADYQIEGDPAGSAKSMKKTFKQYMKEKK